MKFNLNQCKKNDGKKVCSINFEHLEDEIYISKKFKRKYYFEANFKR